MNTKKYMQTDGAWSELGYPSYPCYVGRDGCGMVSIANILIEMEQYAKYTPATIQPYCRQFASPDCEGTYWAGIPKMLSHYGLTEVKEHPDMASLWKELAKGDRVAVYMMGNSPGGSLGVHWTSGGHFICSVGYRYKDNDHQVYVKDSYSNSDKRNGWLGYKTHLRGDVRAVWSGKLVGKPTPPPVPPKPGQLVVDGICGEETVMAMEQFFKVAIDGVISGQLLKWSNLYPSITAISYGSGGSKVIYKLQAWLNLSDPDGILGPNTTKAWQKRLRDYGYLAKTETIDGIIGVKSMRAWQECLNNDCKPKSSPTPTPTKYTSVIDVSAFQDPIDWKTVKASGIVGAMVRCGYRGYETGKLNEDKMYLNHIKGAYKAGLKVGVYFFTEALNWAEGKEEAEYTMKLIEKAGVTLYYPIAVDTELQSDPKERARHLSRAQRTDAIKGFCETIKERGGVPMIYASTSWFEDKLDMSKLPYKIWCAQYYKKCQYKGEVSMWQYTSEGSVNGVKGVVDMNQCYITKASPMPKPTPSKKTYDGALPTTAEIKVASRNGIHKGIASWCKKIADSGKYGYKQYTDDPDTHKCPICHKGTGNGWNCIGYAFASWKHGGGIPCKCSCDVVYNGLCDRWVDMTTAEVLASMKSRIGVDSIKVIRNGNRAIPASMLGVGDLLYFYNKDDTYQHMGVYVGDGKIADDTSGRSKDIVYGSSYASYNKSMPCLFAVRYSGSRTYIKQGDEGKAVLEWQDYLNWWTDGKFYEKCGKGDGVFGANTHKYTVAFQEKVMGEGQGDGTVGQKTITAAKKVVK